MNTNNYKKLILLGPPNVGKSTFFNRITSSFSLVANYSGTTTIIKKGFLKKSNIEIVDLPGALTINSISPAEKITNQFFLNHQFSHAIAFLSALSFKNDLLNLIDYLEANVISNLIITQIDEQKNIHIISHRLSNLLNIPVKSLVSTKVRLNKQLCKTLLNKPNGTFQIDYHEEVENAIKLIEKGITFSTKFNKRFIAIQLLLNNEGIFKPFLIEKNYSQLIQLKQACFKDSTINYQDLIEEKRKEYVANIVLKVTKLTSSAILNTIEKSWIDKILLNKFFGILIFIIIMSIVYFLSFSEWTGSYLQMLITRLLVGDEEFIGLIGVLKQELITNDTQWFGITLLLDGIFAPVFLVLSFFPYLFIFFILTNILKQVGYYARAICVFDSILERFGLSGQSIISIVAGLGCNLPALMSTRIISSKKERHITAFIIPLIPCSARLSVNTILIALFFHNAFSWLIIIGITILSGFLWLLIGLVLTKTLFRKEHQWIVLTIPKWRKVDILSTLKHSWQTIKSFIFRMGGYLIIAGLLVFLLSSLGLKGVNIYSNNGYSNSFIYYMSNGLSYIFKPLGFGNSWQTSTALISAIPAKEVVLTTLAATTGSIKNIAHILTPAAAISFIIFSSFYTPCTPATTILYHETKSTKWLTLIHLVFSFSLAWLLALVVYQLGSL